MKNTRLLLAHGTPRPFLFVALSACLLLACGGDEESAEDAVSNTPSDDVAGDIAADVAAEVEPTPGDVAEDIEEDAEEDDAFIDTGESDAQDARVDDAEDGSDDDTTSADAEEEVDAVDVSAGASLYETYCAFCHGERGQGYLADNANALNNQEFLRTATDDFLQRSVIYGRPGTVMSPWGVERGGPLNDDDVDEIVRFIRTWQTEPTLDVSEIMVEGSALRGGTLYGVVCASCHGEDGEGVTATSLNNPWFHELASDGFIRHGIAVGRPGDGMRGYAGTRSPQDIDDLVSYIREWRTPVDGTPLEPFVPDIANAVLNPEGEPAAFALREDRFAAAADVKAAMDAGQRIVVLDARPTADYLDSHIAGATSLPFYDLDDAAIAALPSDTFIITYCGCPHAVSGQLMNALLEAGFTQVGILDEGFYYWGDQPWPLATGRAPFGDEEVEE